MACFFSPKILEKRQKTGSVPPAEGWYSGPVQSRTPVMEEDRGQERGEQAGEVRLLLSRPLMRATE